MREIVFRDLGTIDYKQAWDLQENIFQHIIDQKMAMRKGDESFSTRDYLLFCEHPHVYTLGKSGSLENLLVNEGQLNDLNAQFYKINRGGDITYHGPGQLVGYPILNLDQHFTDIHLYLRKLEEIFIRILADYDLKGERSKGETGVWLDAKGSNPRKILALGVRASRWVCMHGWAFNVNTQLSYFKHIVPCGITDKEVTSLQKELGREICMEEVSEKARQYFSEIFEVTLAEKEFS